VYFPVYSRRSSQERLSSLGVALDEVELDYATLLSFA
jgi:hypothetical protein